MKPTRTAVLHVTLALAWFVAAPVRAAALEVGQRFPDLGSFALEGTPPDLTDAKVVIIDFWASWCAPCKASFPVYEALQKQFGPSGVQILAVNVDRDASKMQAFLRRQPVSFAVIRDAQSALVAAVDVPTMPTAFILDRHGVVRFVHRGFHGDETRRRYEEQIRQLLQETETP